MTEAHQNGFQVASRLRPANRALWPHLFVIVRLSVALPVVSIRRRPIVATQIIFIAFVVLIRFRAAGQERRRRQHRIAEALLLRLYYRTLFILLLQRVLAQRAVSIVLLRVSAFAVRIAVRLGQHAYVGRLAVLIEVLLHDLVNQITKMRRLHVLRDELQYKPDARLFGERLQVLLIAVRRQMAQLVEAQHGEGDDEHPVDQVGRGYDEQEDEPEPQDHVDFFVDDVYWWRPGERRRSSGMFQMFGL